MCIIVVDINLRIRKLINGVYSNGKARLEMIILFSTAAASRREGSSVFYVRTSSIRRKGIKETVYIIISKRALDSASLKYSILIKRTHPRRRRGGIIIIIYFRAITKCENYANFYKIIFFFSSVGPVTFFFLVQISTARSSHVRRK